jgi:hypothetical protein
MSNYVFVIDTNKTPCNPVHPGIARHLLKSGKAAVFRRYPFTLILKAESTEPVREIQIKIDPGSKTTGIALTQGAYVIWGAELTHRGQAIKASLESRKSLRRGRRATGSFNISTTNSLVQGISHKYCKFIHKKDGYGYSI